MIWPDWQPAPVSSYRNWSLPFSTAGRTELKLAMKRCRSEKEGKIYLRTTVKDIKRLNSCWKQEPVQVPTT